jgi:hypothetical protein
MSCVLWCYYLLLLLPFQALADGDIAKSFEDADQARKMPEMRRSPILMEVWSSLAEYANRASCQGVWYQRSLHEVHSSNVTCVAWSQDGKLVATGSSDCKILVWDAKTGEMVSSCTGHQGAVQVCVCNVALRCFVLRFLAFLVVALRCVTRGSSSTRDPRHGIGCVE